MKDLNQSEVLEELLDAGATSLKIEGRLKDVTYVKNVTAAYRRKLDAIFARRKEYARASSGTCRFDFQPQLDKSFSRGFTHYFLQGRGGEITSFDTPKSLGEEMGTLKEQRGGYLTVAGVKPFHNGDGVCFLDEQGRLQGFRINRWMVTNSIRQGKCLVSNPVPDFIVTSTRSLNVFLPANPPNVKSVFVGSCQILLSGLA